jgi:CubicO group peptidase (beta-lactamase class C family)
MDKWFVSLSRMRTVAVAAWLGLLCLPQGGPALAQDSARTVQRVVDGVIQPLMSAGNFPGAIVGVSLRGERTFVPYGTHNDAGDPFATDTLVEIGSCTKVFTTALFAEAIGAGAMAPK